MFARYSALIIGFVAGATGASGLILTSDTGLLAGSIISAIALEMLVNHKT
jgi:hypothetical protein